MRSSIWLTCSTAALLVFASPLVAQKGDDKGGPPSHERGAQGEPKGGGPETTPSEPKAKGKERAQTPDKGGEGKRAEPSKKSKEKTAERPEKSDDTKGDKRGTEPTKRSTERATPEKSGEGKEGGRTAEPTGKATEGGTKQTDRTPDKAAGPEKSGEPKAADRAPESGGAGTGARVKVSDQQRTNVRQTILREGNVNRVTKVDVSINIGTRLPRSVHLARLPTAVISIVPEYRSYEYFVAEDDRICIVDPATYEIVEVIDDSGRRTADVGGPAGGLTLTSEEREIIIREIAKRDEGRADMRFVPRQGEEVPRNITVHEFPEVVVRQVPKVTRYKYFAVESQIAIVDPSGSKVELVLGGRG